MEPNKITPEQWLTLGAVFIALIWASIVIAAA
jgi:hypothetical protein